MSVASLSRVFAGAALTLALFTLATAHAVADPVLVTEKKIEQSEESHTLSYVYPETGVPTIDAEIEAEVQALLTQFKADLAQRGGENPPPYSAELQYSVERNDDQVFAVLLWYSYYTGGAHGGLKTMAFNYLMPAAARIYIPELVTPDGFKRVSKLTMAELKQLLGSTVADEIMISSGAGPYTDNYDIFVLRETEFAIYFDPYQVASYAAGPQQVHIPFSKLDGLMREDPLAPLASFDCAKAQTQIETTICSNVGLARLDRSVADVYARRRSLGDAEETLQQTQRDWMEQRDKTCGPMAGDAMVACLEGHYETRLKALQDL